MDAKPTAGATPPLELDPDQEKDLLARVEAEIKEVRLEEGTGFVREEFIDGYKAFNEDQKKKKFTFWEGISEFSAPLWVSVVCGETVLGLW